MQAFSGERLLSAWDQAQGQDNLRRALTLIAAGMPDRDPDELAALSLFERDWLLLKLREMSFGPTLEAMASCPACGDRLEFAMPVAALVNDLEERRRQDFVEWEEDGKRLRLRGATTLDLLASADAQTVEMAEALVLKRCLSGDERGPAGSEPLARSDVRARFDELHACTSPRCAIVCPHCGERSTQELDVVQFVWTEVRHAALLLLNDIHVLARQYGWAERDIATMSAHRRAAYLEMASS